MESEAAGIARNVLHKANLFKAIPTEMKETLDGIVQETAQHSPLIDAKDILQQFAEKKVVFAKEAYDNIVGAVKEAAKQGNGNVLLPELHAILRTARSQASSRADKKAIELVKDEILDTMEKHISKVHPLGDHAGKLFRRLNNEIGTKLGIAEDAMELFARDPLKAVSNVARNPEARGVIKALDHLTGSNFTPQIEKLAATVTREGAKQGEVAALKASQAEARGLLKNLLTASAIGSGGFSNVMLSLLIGRMPGALPLEAPAARAAMGAAKAAPGVTAAVGKGAEALFGQPRLAAPAPVAESDLDEESP
jgi:hypothetical protein